GVEEVDLEPTIRRDFDRVAREIPRPKKDPYRLFWDQNMYCGANLIAGAWLRGSAAMLIAAEGMDVGTCRDMGVIRGYILDIGSGTVVSVLQPRELRVRFPKLLSDAWPSRDDIRWNNCLASGVYSSC